MRMHDFRSPVANDGDSAGLPSDSVILSNGAARVVIDKGSLPVINKETGSKARVFTHESPTEGVDVAGLEARLLAAETAKRVAEAANELAQREITHLKSNAHDANNALSGVMGYVDMLRGTVDDKANEYLEIAFRETQRVAALVKRTMNPDGNLKLDKVPVELHSLIDTVLDSAKPFLKGDIKVDFAQSERIVIDADLVNLHSVLLNLVKNAGEALEDGLETNTDPNIVVRFSRVRIDKNNSNEFLNHGEYVKIEVIDNASGVPKDLRSRIFDKGGASTKGTKGHGLGLPMVRNIVEAHRGAIFLDSVTAEDIAVNESLRGQNTGSSFMIYLPLSEKSQATVG